MIKEIPILFKREMVLANLSLSKTNTRRLSGLDKINNNPDQWELNPAKWMRRDGWPFAMFTNYDADESIVIRCPYGDVGDVLWVREMLYQNGELGLQYVADREDIDESIIPSDYKPYRNYAHCNIPSIHMPKWASRIWIRNEKVQLQRLHDISQEDAEQEGIEFDWSEGKQFKNYANDLFEYGDSRMSFESLWRKFNGNESWERNPWVWVLKYTILSTTGRPKE